MNIFKGVFTNATLSTVIFWECEGFRLRKSKIAERGEK